MNRLSKKIDVIIRIIVILGILFIYPFSLLKMKIILLLFILLLFILTLFMVLYIRLLLLDKKIYNCDFKELKPTFEKIIEGKTPISKFYYKSRAFMFFYYINDIDKLTKLKDKEIVKYKNTNDSVQKILRCIHLMEYFILSKEIDQAKELQKDLYNMLRTVNLDYNYLTKKKILFMYENLKYDIIFSESNYDKKLLEEAEKYYLLKFKTEDKMLYKLIISNCLVTIYEKLGDKEKAKEYAEFLIANHKDYYVDSKRIAKYSK